MKWETRPEVTDLESADKAHCLQVSGYVLRVAKGMRHNPCSFRLLRSSRSCCYTAIDSISFYATTDRHMSRNDLELSNVKAHPLPLLTTTIRMPLLDADIIASLMQRKYCYQLQNVIGLRVEGGRQHLQSTKLLPCADRKLPSCLVLCPGTHHCQVHSLSIRCACKVSWISICYEDGKEQRWIEGY